MVEITGSRIVHCLIRCVLSQKVGAGSLALHVRGKLNRTTIAFRMTRLAAFCFCALLLSVTSLAITNVQASGDPDAMSASNAGNDTGSAADRQSAAARSSSPDSSNADKQRSRSPDAGASDSGSGNSGSSRAGSSPEGEALAAQRSGAAEMESSSRSPNDRLPSTDGKPSPSLSSSPSGRSEKPGADSNPSAENDALNARRSGAPGADSSSRAPDTLAQLPSTSDKSSPSPSSSPADPLQPGTGMREGTAMNRVPNSFSEFIENYWLWLLIPLALSLFGLAKFLTRGKAET